MKEGGSWYRKVTEKKVHNTKYIPKVLNLSKFLSDLQNEILQTIK